MTNTNYSELFQQIDLDHSIKDFEYTRRAMRNIRTLTQSEDFRTMDSETIYSYLQDTQTFVFFCDYLKRYIYQNVGIEEPFSEVDDAAYRTILQDSFEATRTPKSFTPTSTKWNAIFNNWLKQYSVRRPTVFLLGFGLHMPVEDVSEFLTKILKEEDFRFDDAQEVIYWFCYRNGFGYPKAVALQEAYETLDAKALPEDKTVMRAEDILLLPDFHLEDEEDLLFYLACLKGSGEQSHQLNAYRHFSELVEEAREEIARYYTRDDDEDDNKGRKKIWNSADISNGDIEKWICSGIPTTGNGNLMKASDSMLSRLFGNRRMSRQRLDELLSKKAPVERFDLITMKFFLAAISPIDDAAERYRTFVEQMNEILEDSHMMSIYPANPYEAFILLCLLTDGPLAVYSDIWEMSYQNED